MMTGVYERCSVPPSAAPDERLRSRHNGHLEHIRLRRQRRHLKYAARNIVG